MAFSAHIYSEADQPRLLAFVTAVHADGWQRGYSTRVHMQYKNAVIEPTRCVG